MDRDKISSAITTAKTSSKKRGFTQSVDLIVNLRDLDVQKPEGAIDEYVKLPVGMKKTAKICALVGSELKAQAEQLCDKAITLTDFPKWASKSKCRHLVRDFDFFIAQADLMPQVAKAFGAFLGPVGKMPNPKAGQIVQPKANLKPLVDALKNTIRIRVKKAPVIQCAIGDESMDAKALTDNASFIVNHLEHRLPKGQSNIQAVLIKTTMGKPARVS